MSRTLSPIETYYENRRDHTCPSTSELFSATIAAMPKFKGVAIDEDELAPSEVQAISNFVGLILLLDMDLEICASPGDWMKPEERPAINAYGQRQRRRASLAVRQYGVEKLGLTIEQIAALVADVSLGKA